MTATTKLRQYYEDVVQHLQWAVLEIQNNGILVDKQRMQEYHAIANSKQEEIYEMVRYALGFEFNPNSSQQVQKVYADLGLELGGAGDKLALIKCLKKCPDAKALVETTLDYRWLGKVKGTYLETPTDRWSRAHSTLRTYGTLTWRLSSSEINLQNMPRHPKHEIHVKNIYVAPPGFSLVEFDYGQLEYRIPAYASRCKRLINIFESGKNIHFDTVEILFHIRQTAKDNKYDFAKRFVYADGYGSGATNISNHMLVDTLIWTEPSIVQTYQKLLREAYPEKFAWHEECWERCKKENVIYEGFGIPRYLYGHSDDFRGIGYSWPTQATASGIINRALVCIYRDLHDSKYFPFIRIICQVHDSLMFEVANEVLDDFIHWVKERMEQRQTIFGYPDVAFPTEAKVGQRWGELKEVKC